MPADLEGELEKAQATLKTLTSSVATIAAGIKTHASNYDNACNMYFASEDHIAELKKKVASDSKVAPELMKWESNHPKLAARVKTEFAECQKLRAGVAQADNSAMSIRTTFDKINKGATANPRDIEDLKTFKADVKTYDTNLAAVEKKIEVLDKTLKECMPYPKTIK